MDKMREILEDIVNVVPDDEGNVWLSAENIQEIKEALASERKGENNANVYN